jgi:DNA polymerase III subunit epsilon
MFAIVDIETTGGSPADNRIIEIAVIVHDGREITAEFQSLVNPGMPVPKFITVLTGISDQMVKDAPSFGEIAHEVLKLLGDKVFVAHNVNFDYSFLRREFARVNLSFNQRRACTIRLSRRLLPGLPSYSLGNLCRQVGIEIYNQHRAGGDARATARLLELLLEKDNCGAINEAIKKSSRELSLPPHLNRKDFDTLPNRAGIYRFHDSKGRIIYIGKAVNIKKRVAGHFALGSESRSKLNFINEIVSVSYRETACRIRGDQKDLAEVQCFAAQAHGKIRDL